MTERLPLFVFGTLRRGERNHDLLAGRYVSTLPAVLPGYAVVGPLMIAPRLGGLVTGELYQLAEERYDGTLVVIDELEGIPAGKLVGPWYRRDVVMVDVGGDYRPASAYVSARASLPPEDA